MTEDAWAVNKPRPGPEDSQKQEQRERVAARTAAVWEADQPQTTAEVSFADRTYGKRALKIVFGFKFLFAFLIGLL